jgi:signal peptide peptidase SppA
MRGQLLLAHLMTSPLAVMPERIPIVVQTLNRIVLGEPTAPQVLDSIRAEADIRAARANTNRAAAGSVAIVPLYGYMMQRPMEDVSGPSGTSTMRVGNAIREAIADDSVASILIDIDSPGGEVFGVQELGALVAEANQQKPVCAIANSMACSAAYWVGSQASEFYVAPGGIAGSIGVYTVHEDYSRAIDAAGVTATLVKAGKFKAEANQMQPLTDEDRDALQSMVDSYYTAFVQAVASGRKTSQKAVREGMGQGRSLVAGEAVSAGLVDGVMTITDLVSKMHARNKRASSRPNAAHADRMLKILG